MEKDLFDKMVEKDSKFAEFVKLNEHRSVEEIAKHYSIDLKVIHQKQLVTNLSRK